MSKISSRKYRKLKAIYTNKIQRNSHPSFSNTSKCSNKNVSEADSPSRNQESMKQQVFDGASGFAEGTRISDYIFDSSLQNGWNNGLCIDRLCLGRTVPVGLNEMGLWKVI